MPTYAPDYQILSKKRFAACEPRHAARRLTALRAQTIKTLTQKGEIYALLHELRLAAEARYCVEIMREYFLEWPEWLSANAAHYAAVRWTAGSPPAKEYFALIAKMREAQMPLTRDDREFISTIYGRMKEANRRRLAAARQLRNSKIRY